MAPSAVTLDLSDDLPAPPPTKANGTSTSRTLLLAPPSVAAHPEKLSNTLAAHDRSSTDIQMLDRLALGLVSLPSATYDTVLLLADAEGSAHTPLSRDSLARIVAAMREGGLLREQNRAFGREQSSERTEAILAGLVDKDGVDGMMKPLQSAGQAVPLRLNRQKKPIETAPVVENGNGNTLPEVNGKRKSDASQATPAGVGFDFGDDLDALVDEDQDDLIDEDDLLTEEDKVRQVVPPPECQPKAGKRRRRACKDCTCGLAQKLEAEDRAKRAAADRALGAMTRGNGATKADAAGGVAPATAMLDADDLAEVDFTVQGKVGSCGNCALGDAFRCDGCPYVGLPAFKPGEEVRLLNNDVQL